ncbi:putative baseplate wedge [Sinorhizobium phage phiM9]|uniref:Putative baseplate wedge n=1 Tax=Sinorhizobium phage phiM9 TaxID=1636182 RepID=A0A0F6R4X7_9CAUD|nr:putative baseplate wedge [Sinorhizobium phage phiM9]AKE44712.1 putative baseplate wedge [Sinorhizobium phage phiM9]
MADNTLKFREHDLGAVLKNLRDFMSNQDFISDYNVDMSVIDVLLSAMAYNTQNNAITANALFAEQNIDTAILRKNIVKKAKEYGYLPYSTVSSKASVDITVVPNVPNEAPNQLVLDKGTQFTGLTENGDAAFTVVRTQTSKLTDGAYRFDDVELYQGTYGTVDIFIDKNRRTQVYEIPVDDIDLNFLEVYVQETSDSEDFTEFKFSNTSINVDGDDPVYFLQEIKENRYGIEFGDGVIGRSVQDEVLVRVVFFKTLGQNGNGVKTFTFKSSPDTTNKINAYSVNTVTVSKSTGGLASESDESVKRNAPKFFVTQNRGANPNDYSDLVREKFPFINSISVWSGREGRGYYDQFGRIYISANTEKSQFLTESQKRDIYDMIVNQIGISGIIPIIVDVDNIYIDLNIRVFVNDYIFLKSSDIITKVRNYAQFYNDENLNSFNSEFEFSKFTAGIDDIDDSITSNITSILLHKRVFPDTRINTNIQTSFMNPIKSIISNNFMFETKTVFVRSTFLGSLNIYEVIDGSDVLVRENVGTVNFDTGELSISDITINRVNPQTKDIRFYAEPVINNVKSLRNNIVTISEVTATVEQK